MPTVNKTKLRAWKRLTSMAMYRVSPRAKVAHILISAGVCGGVVSAAQLVRTLAPEHQITLASRSDIFVFYSNRRNIHMLHVTDIPAEETHALLAAANFGHLGCTQDGQPYVVPMNYAYDRENIYFFTTEGMKTKCLAANPKVCLQVEHIDDTAHWKSVIATGQAQRLTLPEDIEHAIQLIVKRFETLRPALSRTTIGDQEREGRIVLYRIRPTTITGRQTVKP